MSKYMAALFDAHLCDVVPVSPEPVGGIGLRRNEICGHDDFADTPIIVLYNT